MARHINLKDVHDPKQLMALLNAMNDNITSLITAVNEINTWAETLAAKLNADAGVTDENYDATITAGQITASVTSSS